MSGAAMGALGEALHPQQLVTVAVSCVTWFAMQRFCASDAFSRAILPAKVQRAITARQHRVLGLNSVNFVHSVIVSGGAIWACLFDPVVWEEPTYGRSSLMVNLCAVSVGYFIWDVWVCARCVRDPGVVDWQMLTHAVLGVGVFTTGQYPFLPWMAVISLGFEASTPALNVFRALYDLGMQESHRNLYRGAKTVFFLTFFFARIVVGLPASLRWWVVMVEVLSGGVADGRPLHSPYPVYFLLGANIVLNALNLFWFRLIVRNALGWKGGGPTRARRNE